MPTEPEGNTSSNKESSSACPYLQNSKPQPFLNDAGGLFPQLGTSSWSAVLCRFPSSSKKASALCHLIADRGLFVCSFIRVKASASVSCQSLREAQKWPACRSACKATALALPKRDCATNCNLPAKDCQGRRLMRRQMVVQKDLLEPVVTALCTLRGHRHGHVIVSKVKDHPWDLCCRAGGCALLSLNFRPSASQRLCAEKSAVGQLLRLLCSKFIYNVEQGGQQHAADQPAHEVCNSAIAPHATIRHNVGP